MDRMRDHSGIVAIEQGEVQHVYDTSKSQLKLLSNSMHIGEYSVLAYIPADRLQQRTYLILKNSPTSIVFVEKYPLSTSKRMPSFNPIDGSTPLGLFTVPDGGVSIHLPGQVISVEKPELVAKFFTPIKIKGETLYFVNNLDARSENEVAPVATDSHTLEGRNATGRGIKMHDTTVLDKLGEPGSSGCLRIPAIRRLTLMTARNKYPTLVYVHLVGTRTLEEMERDGEYGGYFGGEPLAK